MIAMTYTKVTEGRTTTIEASNIDLNSVDSVKEFAEMIKTELVLLAGGTLKEEIARGFDKDHLTLVDGKRTTNLFLVKPFGKINFIAKQDIREVLLETYSKILMLSRIRSGGYLKMNFVYLNTTRIATSIRELEQYLERNEFYESDVIRFVNFAPYAGKLERNNFSANKGGDYVRIKKSTDEKKRSGEFVRKPNGTYVLAAKSIKAKHGKKTDIKFELLPGNYITPQVPLMKWRTQEKWRNTYDPNGKFNSGYYLYPTITIRLRGGGIKGLLQ
jgi:hypothetical protein